MKKKATKKQATKKRATNKGDQEPITPFDQEQRYRLIGDLLHAFRGAGRPLRILDVGGRTGVLRKYLAPDDKVILADVEESSESDLVLASGSALPFADRSFDAVVAADTLEHVPVEAREAFVGEACRVARGVTVLAGPYYHPRVAEAEQRLAEFIRSRIGAPHRYLEEHLELGLPDREKVEGWCRDAGAREVRSLGHGNLERWLGLMSIALLLDDDNATRDLAARFHNFYNLSLLPEDRSGRVYRHLVVAVMGDDLPGGVEEVFAPREVAEETGKSILSALDHLAAFDHARDLFETDRVRLESEISRRDDNLAGHRESLGTAEDDLAQHKLSLTEAEGQLDQHKESLSTAEKDLAQHKDSLGTAEKDLAQHKDSLGTAEEDLAQHKVALAEAEGHLVQYKEALEDSVQDLEGHAESLARIRAELAEAQAEIGFRGELLEKEQTEFEARLATAEDDLAQHKAALSEAETQLGQHKEALKDVTSDLEGHVAALALVQKELQLAQAEIEARGEALSHAHEHSSDLNERYRLLMEETRRYRKVRDFLLRRKTD